jgi:hypothetical protein
MESLKKRIGFQKEKKRKPERGDLLTGIEKLLRGDGHFARCSATEVLL